MNFKQENLGSPSTIRKRRIRQKRADVQWAIAMFLILQIGFSLAIRAKMVRMEDSTTFASKFDRFQHQLDAASDDSFVALAFGSSRVMNGLDAGYLADRLSDKSGRPTIAYNFGVSGCGNIYAFLSLEKILHHGITPDVVFVEVYPGLLVPNAEKEWFRANELRSKNFENTERYGIQPVARPWYREWLASWHTYRFDVLNCISPKLLPMALRENWAQNADEHGWVAVDRHIDQHQNNNESSEPAKKQLDYHPGGSSCQALRDTLKLCRENGIECRLVWLPEPAAFRSIYYPESVDAICSFLSKLDQEFGFATIVSRDWVGEDGFYDITHLNQVGAKEFTGKLANEFLRASEREMVARDVGSGSTLQR